MLHLSCRYTLEIQNVYREKIACWEKGVGFVAIFLTRLFTLRTLSVSTPKNINFDFIFPVSTNSYFYVHVEDRHPTTTAHATFNI